MELNLKLRNDVWQVHGTVIAPDGRKIRVRKSTGFPKHLKNLASAKMPEIVAEALRGDASKPKADNIASAIRMFVGRPNPPGLTDVGTLERFGKKFGHVRLADVNQTDILLYVQSKGNKANTVAREINTINAMFNYAREVGMDVPPIKLKKPTVDDSRLRWLTESERDALIDACDPQIKGLVAFLFYTGARLGEAFSVRGADLLDGKVFLRTKKGKTKKVRTRAVPLLPELVDLMPTGVKPSALVFTNTAGNMWDRSDFYDFFNKAKLKAGVQDFRPHDARHTFASLLIQRGASLRAVADLLGHTSLAMVMRYSHLAPSHLEDTVGLLGCRGTSVAHKDD